MRLCHHVFTFLIAATLALAIGSTAAAQGRGKGSANPKPAVHGSPASQGQGRGAGPQGPKTGRPATPPARGEGAKPSSPPGQATRTGPAETSINAKSAQDHLAQQPALRARLSELLPPGTDIYAAAAGFRNFGQFVAAVHVSRNLGIQFGDLKARVTGPEPLSLGQAIAELKPGVRADAEARRAEAAARDDLKVRKR